MYRVSTTRRNRDGDYYEGVMEDGETERKQGKNRKSNKKTSRNHADLRDGEIGTYGDRKSATFGFRFFCAPRRVSLVVSARAVTVSVPVRPGCWLPVPVPVFGFNPQPMIKPFR